MKVREKRPADAEQFGQESGLSRGFPENIRKIHHVVDRCGRASWLVLAGN
jgi:hypothetical protein